MSIVANSPSVLRVQTDEDALFAAITELRNAYTTADERQPLNFVAGDEKRTSARVPMHVPVQIAAAVRGGRKVHLLEGEIAGEVLDLSLPGVSFQHAEPFLHFFFAMRFDIDDASEICLLAQLCWTVREAEGLYRSGAELIGIIEHATKANCPA